jgi:hypothetical protein
MSVERIISYVGWAVILFFCGTWFIQGLKGTYKEKPQSPVKVKRWLLTRTITAWILALLFGTLIVNQGQRLSTSPSSFDIFFLMGALTPLAGLALSLSWIRKLNRERRERRRNAAETAS